MTERWSQCINCYGEDCTICGGSGFDGNAVDPNPRPARFFHAEDVMTKVLKAFENVIGHIETEKNKWNPPQ